MRMKSQILMIGALLGRLIDSVACLMYNTCILTSKDILWPAKQNQST
jgi:hypothetical protein